MSTMPARRHASRLRAAAAAALVAVGATLLGPVPAAQAAGAVSVTGPLGSGKADAEYSTAVTVSGSGFQSIAGGFGGIYVLFGWIDGSGWRPSQGGAVGADYLYVPDSEAKDNAGFQRFVAFPGSETEASAQAVMGADGSWSVDLVIPGPSFTSLDRDGAPTTVDCLEVQCGVITIGAHGVKNPSNETFTPVAFVVPDGDAATADATGSPAPTEGDDAPADAAPAHDAAAPPEALGDLRLGVPAAPLTAGDALPFTARGFAAGEQVVATLDGGVTAVGPLAAGASGEVAGVLPLPSDLAAGTHLLAVEGAATGGRVESELTVAANPLAAATSATADDGTPAWLLVAMLIAIAIAAVLILSNVVVAVMRAARRRRARRAAALA
ncbi:hypothetical protein [Microbacterium rhizophilus]|uniref:hypothetical protein n=1 Tax=Microbacterium rhizophilus TaxID=3138934 RepID=UPI0031EA771D